MNNGHIDKEMAEELRRLALLPDDEIDTSDISEIESSVRGERGRFYPKSIEEKGYDIRGIANWVLGYLDLSNTTVTNFSLNKLLYFIIERALVERHILLSPAKIEAWEHGPVFREVYHALKQNDRDPIVGRIKKYSVSGETMIEAREDFSEEDVDFFKSVLKDYTKLPPSQLWRVSHSSTGPWHSVWHYKGRTNPGMEIKPLTILRKASYRRAVNA